MTDARPTIFLSAVSAEFSAARQIIANTLLTLGYLPSWQETFGTAEGDLKAVLRRKIDVSAGLIQLVGDRYGFAPPEPDTVFGEVSYTQYEALYAAAKCKPVWYIFAAPELADSSNSRKPDPNSSLQAAYRHRIESSGILWHTATSQDQLRFKISELQAEFDKLREEWRRERRRSKRFRVVCGVSMLLLAAGVLWAVKTADHTQSEVQDELQSLRSTVATLAAVYQNPAASDAALGTEAKFERAVALTAKAEKRSPSEVLARVTTFIEIIRQREAIGKADFYDLGLKAFAENNFRKAVEYARKAITAADVEIAAIEMDAVEKKTKALTRKREALFLAGSAEMAASNFQPAVEHFREAVALSSMEKEPDAWAGMNGNYATALFYNGNYREAASAALESAKLLERIHGFDHQSTLVAYNNAALFARFDISSKGAEEILRRVIESQKRISGPEHPETVMAQANLGCLLWDRGDLEQATPLLAETLRIRLRDLGPEHVDTLTSQFNLPGDSKTAAGLAESEKRLRDAIAISQRKLGTHHPVSLDGQSKLVDLLRAKDDIAAAETLLRGIIAKYAEKHGAAHPSTLENERTLASILWSQGQLDEAQSILKRIVEAQRKVLCSDHPMVGQTCNTLAMVQMQKGDYEAARSNLEFHLEILERTFGGNYEPTLAVVDNLACCLAYLGHIKESNAMFLRCIADQERLYGLPDPRTLRTFLNYVASLQIRGEMAAAERQLLRAVDACRSLPSADSTKVSCFSAYWSLLQLKRDFRSAEKIAREIVDLQERFFPADLQGLARATERLARTVSENGHPEEARTLRDRALALQEKATGKDTRPTLKFAATMAELLRDSELYAEASELIKRVLETQERSFGPDDADTLTSVKILATLAGINGEYGLSSRLHRRVVENLRKLRGANDATSLEASVSLAVASSFDQDYGAAERLCQDTLARVDQHLGSKNPLRLQAKTTLALIFRQRGDLAQAEECYRSVLEEREQRFGPEDQESIQVAAGLGVTLGKRGALEEAEQLLRRNLSFQERRRGPRHRMSALGAYELASVLARKGDVIGARSLVTRSNEDLLRMLGPAHPQTIAARNLQETLNTVQAGGNTAADANPAK